MGAILAAKVAMATRISSTRIKKSSMLSTILTTTTATAATTTMTMTARLTRKMGKTKICPRPPVLKKQADRQVFYLDL